MKSCIDLATDLNVSKQTIFNNAKRLDIELIKQDNTLYIQSDDDIKRIISRVLNNKAKALNIDVSELMNNDSSLKQSTDKEDTQDVIEDDLRDKIDNLQADNERLQNELNSLNNQSEIIQLLKSQIEDMKQSQDKEIKRLEADKDKQIQSLSKDKEQYIIQVNNLNDLLKQQQQLLHNQQSLALQSNEKIKALEIELNEIKEDTKHDTTDLNVHAEDVKRDVQKDNKVDNFYRDLKEDRSNKQSQSFLSRLFKR